MSERPMIQRPTIQRLTAAALLLSCLALPALAADRNAAKKKFMEGYRLYKEKPAAAAKKIEEALKLDPTYDQARTFLGWLYNVQMGDAAKALPHYDYLIERAEDRKVKAEAYSEKANIVYTTKKDAKAAVKLYNAAYKTYRLWRYADRASNLLLHEGLKDEALTQAERAEVSINKLIDRLETATEKETDAKRKAAGEARLAGEQKNRFKVRVHVATCLLANGKGGEAESLLKELDLDKAPTRALYNVAMLYGEQGKTEKAAAALTGYLKTFGTAAGRNMLREFIRTEPSFKAMKDSKAFKPLVTDEPEDA